MSTANSSRGRRRHAHLNGDQPSSPSRSGLNPLLGPKKRNKPPVLNEGRRPDWDEVLGQFSDALGIVETAHRALEANEEHFPSFSDVSTLRVGIEALKRAYTQLDLAILTVS